MASNPKIVGLSEQKLRAIFSDNSLELGELNKDTGKYTIRKARGIEFESVDADIYTIGKIPINGIERPYYLGIIIDYRDRTLEQIGVHVFQRGDPWQLLIRAEWSANAGAVQHAQPHWHTHIHDNSVITPQWNDDEEDEFVQVKPSTPFYRVHLAMCASWLSNDIQIFDIKSQSESVHLNWLNRVVKYIQYQFSFKD